MKNDRTYAGFWIRVWAAIVDTILIIAITFPLLIWIYGSEYLDATETGFIAGPADFLISWIFPAIAVVLFWKSRQATPGKMLVGARVIDAESGETLTTGQCVGRYLGYYPSMLVLGLGIFWVAFDKRKQGWHDKLAGTVVIRNPKSDGASDA